MTEYEKIITIVNNDPLTVVDAIVLLEGDGFFRVAHAAKLYKENYAAKVVFSGGITNHGYGSYPFEECAPRLIELGVPRENVIFENVSQHTSQQAQMVCQMAVDNGWKRLILVATPHHQCRAYLTFLKHAVPLNLIIINSVAQEGGWFSDHGWGSRFDMLEQEDQRIKAYTEKGDLATCAEAIEYQRWKEKQI